MTIKTATDKRIRDLSLWKGDVDITPLHGGLSNESFVITDGPEKFVVRFGRDYPFHHVFRDREVMAARAAHAAGFAPEVVHDEPGIMVSRFIDGTTYSEDDVRANHIEIAQLMHRFHETMSTHVSGAGFIFWVFHVIRDYARTLAAGNSRMIADLPGYLELASKLESTQIALPIVYGHHDLLPANFMDDGSKLWLIDFEYAGFGTAMFDLAGITSNAGFEQEQAIEFLSHYLGHKPEAEFVQSHAAMSCASLLREAMWSMVSELHLDTPGVDYVAYTTENLERLEHALEAYQCTYGKV
jgi:thiamine kinase-like enzyme